MAVTAQIKDSTDTTGPYDIASFEKVYLAFGFPAADFATKLKEFYDSQVADTGWFIPSQAFKDWFEQMRTDYLKSLELSTVGAANGDRLLVIDRILRLLIAMIDVLQRVSASQAERLTFLTHWQQVYTNQLNDVHIFSKGDDTTVGEKGDANAIGSANTIMQTQQEKIRGRRSAIQDEAKQMQTVINQSQDAANQQTNMATAILQQMSSILSTIYR
jgi:hypothetical protein